MGEERTPTLSKKLLTKEGRGRILPFKA